MTFRVNSEGIITSATSGREIVGSQVKQGKIFLDFVVIKRENRSRRPKYGIYGGKMDSMAVVRTTWGDEVLPMDIITPIVPSQSLIDHFIQDISERLSYFTNNNRIGKFLLEFVRWKYPNRYEDLHIPVCSVCGSLFPERVQNGVPVCVHCYQENYITCEHCGRSVERSQAIRGRCPRCGRYHYITSYHRDVPEREFYGDTRGNSYPYLGVELEVAYGGELDSTVEKVLPLINTDENIYMYCSHDSSLTDGIENITQPMTLEYHRSLYDNYKAVFEKYKELDYLSHDTPCCGFHIHFNRSFFEDDEETCITKLCYLFEKFWKEILLFSRRTNKRQVNRYCKQIDVSIDEFINSSNKSDNHDWRYYALNLINEETIEFRLFRGTLNVDTFFATLELVNNLVLSSRNKTVQELHEMRFTDLLTTDTLKDYWKRMSYPRDL